MGVDVKPTNRVWLLEPVDMYEGDAAVPWKPWYDTCDGVVVLAATEANAREYADQAGQEENTNGRCHPWLSEVFTTCVEVKATDTPGEVLQSVRWA